MLPDPPAAGVVGFEEDPLLGAGAVGVGEVAVDELLELEGGMLMVVELVDGLGAGAGDGVGLIVVLFAGGLFTVTLGGVWLFVFTLFV